MKTSAIRLSLLGLAAALSCAAFSQSPLSFTASQLNVSLPVSVPKDSVGVNKAMEVTPLLICGTDTLELNPVIFRSSLNNKVTERGRKFRDLAPAFCPEYLAGEQTTVTASLQRCEYPALWSNDVRLVAQRELSGCCECKELPTLELAQARYEEPFVPVVAPVEDFTGKAGELQRESPVLQHISKYRPYDSTRILRKEEGSLYVHFPLDKWTVLDDFRDNGPILSQIVDITRQIMADPTSNVKLIQIIGLASVEGNLKHNQELAGNRADALKRYIQQRVPTPDSLYECNNGGEAWTELRDQVSDLDSPYRAELLNIIDTEADPDRREARIKALDGGKAYAYLLENVLSDQRNSGYLRIYYDYVPDTQAAAINEASRLIQAERYAEALQMLQPVSADPRSWNALGVALYMTGAEADALSYFRRAAEGGNAEARKNLDQLAK